MWFVSPGGRVSAGTFTVGTSGHATVTLATAGHPGQYSTLGVTLEPAGSTPPGEDRTSFTPSCMRNRAA